VTALVESQSTQPRPEETAPKKIVENATDKEKARKDVKAKIRKSITGVTMFFEPTKKEQAKKEVERKTQSRNRGPLSSSLASTSEGW